MTDRNADLNYPNEDTRNNKSTQNEFLLQEPRQPDVMRAKITAAGYTILDNGTGSGWYALLPGETSFFDNADEADEDSDVEHVQNYVGFFSSELDLLEELTDTLDEQAETNDAGGAGDNDFAPVGASLLISSFYKFNLASHEDSNISFVMNVQSKQLLDAKVFSDGKWKILGDQDKQALLENILHPERICDPLRHNAYYSDNLPLWINEIGQVHRLCPFTTLKRDSLGTHVSFEADADNEVDDSFLRNSIQAAIELAKFENSQIVYELAGVTMFVVESDSVDVQAGLWKQRWEHANQPDVAIERQR